MSELMIEGMGCVGYFAGMDNETIETTFGPLDKMPIDVRNFGARGNALARQGDFMQVFPARKFWTMDPRASEVTLEAIATSLAHQCRYAGHMSVDLHYSVAEHSVHIARWILKETGNVEWALCGLMHDASEAYLVDVPRPIKGSLPQYRAIESKVMAVICERFKLPLKMPDIVKEADDRIIADEVHAIMEPMEWHAGHADGLGVAIKCWERKEAREEFLATFWALNGGRE